MRSAAMLLADARFPSGGHAHSGGIEAAAERIGDIGALERFVLGRLHTAGRCAAALAAFACSGRHGWTYLDEEADARTPSPAQRNASRAQGRGLLRAARIAWPADVLDDLAACTPEPHHAVVLGAASAAAGLDPQDAASIAAYGAVTAPATAAVRLLGFDPIAVNAMLAGMSDDIEAIASEVVGLDDLPCDGAPLLEIDAERHARWEVRLFAS